MCISAVLVRPTGRFRFVFIGNRDEFVDRTTREIQIVDGLLCAIDEIAGGTQCALNVELGILANVTNVRLQPHNDGEEKAVSRGMLVRDAANDDLDLEATAANPTHYAGYNLLQCDIRKGSVRYLTNSKQWEGPQVAVLEDGVHCVSNSFLDDDTWPKVVHLKQRLKKVVDDAPSDMAIDDFMEAAAQPLCDGTLGLRVAPDNMKTVDTDYPLLAPCEVALQDGIWIKTPTGRGEFRTLFQTVVVGEVSEDGKTTTVHYWYRPTHTETEHCPWRKFSYEYES